MRILCLTPWFPNRPGDRHGNYIFDSVEALTDLGVDVKVMVARAWKPWATGTIELGMFDKGLALGVSNYPSIPRNYFQSFNNRLQVAALYGPLIEYARRHSVELIHAHTEGMAAIANKVAQNLGVGCTVSIHGINTAHRYLGTDRQRLHFRRALNRCDRVILVGEPLRPFFANLCGRDDHFRVVHNGFRLPAVALEDRDIYSHPSVRLISVSNLHEGKGIDLNLRAFAKLRSEGLRAWNYTIVGDGIERSSLERLVDELDLRGEVHFAGAVPHSEVASWLEQADIFVLPSYREAFGIAYLEAMACGLATIGVHGQGASEFIRHGQNGLLVPGNDLDGLTDVLRYAMTHPGELRTMAATGHQTARRDFTWEKHAQSLVAVYRELLHENEWAQ